ncbi:MAG TPA: hypothetical protein VMZ49_11975 [Patescibacteria group bacterium]|nr:hypothetical protein [Patescibacteria group bacterium]
MNPAKSNFLTKKTHDIFLIVWMVFFICALFPHIARAQSTKIRIVSPIQNLYYHVRDDDGTAPKKGTDVILLFEGAGRLLIYIQDSSDLLTHLGSWSYQAGKLNLDINAEYLSVHSRFAFDLQQRRVNLPFRFFSEGRGSSTWECKPVSLENTVRLVFRGAVLNETQPLKTEEAVSHAAEYARAVIRIFQENKTVRTSPLLSLDMLATPLYAQDPFQFYVNLPVKISPFKNGIRLHYLDGSSAEILLFGWSPPPINHLILKPARLVNDPRVHLNAESSGNSLFDPDSKTALYISPFESTQVINWWDGVLHGAKGTGVVPKIAGVSMAWNTIEAIIKKRGYNTYSLIDGQVTVEKLIKKLVDLKNPGIVILYSHGSAEGSLATAERLTNSNDVGAAKRQFEQVKKRLRAAGHGRLLDMDGVGIISVELGLKVPLDCAWFVAVKPPFWKYIQSLTALNVSFKKSFFYMSACFTDQKPNLREAIRAKVYFAWNDATPPDLSGAIMVYLISQLSRPTHSAEEAYYNLVRVVNTKQIIYKEDRLLNGQIPASAKEKGRPQSPLFAKPGQYIFNGYGLDGRQMIQYSGNGWLNPKLVDVGQIWWLVFAGRWGQNATQGAKNLSDCFSQFWKKKQLGRLKSPFCNSANNGKPPKEAEVAYAVYLLTGEKPGGYSGLWIPRWTLNETRE